MIDVKKLLMLCAAFFVFQIVVHAQGFSSGSTGADGALDLSTMNCPSSVCELQLPESGILNYTTVNIPNGKTLIFRRNSRNTPVVMLAQGNVNVAGGVEVSGGTCPPLYAGFQGTSTPGPGGFSGGDRNQPGFGPGGGALPPGDPNGKWVGPLSLFPIVGGSGGSGYGSVFGGGGGGAIILASSTSIEISGYIYAYGANASVPGFGAGSGGAIRVVANALNISGVLRAIVASCFNCSQGHAGVVRLEASLNALVFTGSSAPAATLSTINPALVSSALPSLTIVSVAGFSVPFYSGSRTDTVDLLLPDQLSDPIAVVVHGMNIPLGSEVRIGLLTSSQGSSTSGTLSGTFENSTATATISGLNRSAVTYLLATATFEPPGSAQSFNPKGKDHVAKIRVESGMGTKPKFVFLRSNGTAIDQAKLPKKFLEQLGL
jgi:hypothetical protein